MTMVVNTFFEKNINYFLYYFLYIKGILFMVSNISELLTTDDNYDTIITSPII